MRRDGTRFVTNIKNDTLGATCRVVEDVLSNRDLLEIDCNEERYRLLQSSDYAEHMGGGKRLIERGTTEWSYISPGVLVARMMRLVCK